MLDLEVNGASTHDRYEQIWLESLRLMSNTEVFCNARQLTCQLDEHNCTSFLMLLMNMNQ